MSNNKKSLRFRHVGIVTQDIEKQKAFYESLGLETESDTIEKVRIVKFKEGIELLQYESMSEANLRKLGISHIAFTSDEESNPLEIVHLPRMTICIECGKPTEIKNSRRTYCSKACKQAAYRRRRLGGGTCPG